MIKRTTVRLPGELLTRAKRKAAAEGRTLTEMIENGLRRELAGDHKQEKARRKPVRIPVSKATGGLRPGVDPTKLLNHVEEMEDLEYVERMRRGFK